MGVPWALETTLPTKTLICNVKVGSVRSRSSPSASLGWSRGLSSGRWASVRERSTTACVSVACTSSIARCTPWANDGFRGRLAATLAYGPQGVLSHRAGGAHWQLIRDAGWIEVTVPQWRRSQGNVLVHEAKLPTDEITVHRGIPVTSVPRTLLDLAAVLSPRQVERAINEAEVRHLWDELSLEHLLSRYPRRAGNSTARAALHGRRGGTTLTRSELEEMFLVLVDEAGLPRPEVNALVEGYEVDAVWRAARVVVELDGRDTHGTTTAFETDRERDRRLVAARWRPIRVTSRQMTDTRVALIGDLTKLLVGATLAA
jgi:hypothetical protein